VENMDISDCLLDFSCKSSNLVIMNRVIGIDLSKGPINVWVGKPMEAVRNPAHSMAFTVKREFQLYHVVTGRLVFTVNSNQQIVEDGDTLILWPGDRATIKVEGGASFHHCHFEIGRGPRNIIPARLSEWAHVVAYAGHHGTRYRASLYLPDVIRLNNPAGITHRLETIRHLYDTANPGGELAVKAHLLLLLQEISCNVFDVLLKSPSKVPFSRSNKHIARAVDYIARNISGSLSVAGTSKHLRLNPDYLTRLFKQSLGESLGSYVLRHRMTRARELLTSSNLNIKETAEAVGFSDPLYFSRVFRREEGMSPSEYILRSSAPEQAVRNNRKK
jgi:AraC-like DNA-binding protein